MARLIHDAFDTALQAQLELEACTRAVPSPPFAENDSEPGDTLYSQPAAVGAAACVTVTMAPATAMVPVRAAPGFGVKV